MTWATVCCRPLHFLTWLWREETTTFHFRVTLTANQVYLKWNVCCAIVENNSNNNFIKVSGEFLWGDYKSNQRKWRNISLWWVSKKPEYTDTNLLKAEKRNNKLSISACMASKLGHINIGDELKTLTLRFWRKANAVSTVPTCQPTLPSVAAPSDFLLSPPLKTTEWLYHSGDANDIILKQ